MRRGPAPAPDGVLGIVVADGTRPAWPDGAFDRVLVDAPCTGLGALRRRPEARWRRQPATSTTWSRSSGRCSRPPSTRCAPAAWSLYATCSPVLAETAGVVEAVLAARDDAVLGDAAALLPDVPDAAGPLPGTVQLWPHRHGTDAMFGALLRRRA